MAAAAVDRSNRNLAIALILVGASRHYGWALFDPSIRGIVSKALGGLAILCLLWIIRRDSWQVLLVLLWWAFEEAQVVGCSVAYLIKPWSIAVGQPLCSSLVGFDIGSIGIFVVAALTFLTTYEDS